MYSQEKIFNTSRNPHYRITDTTECLCKFKIIKFKIALTTCRLLCFHIFAVEKGEKVLQLFVQKLILIQHTADACASKPSTVTCNTCSVSIHVAQ